jgi:hypothetical protein
MPQYRTTRRALLAASLAAGAAAALPRGLCAEDATAPGVRIVEGDAGRLRFLSNGRPVLAYNFGEQLPEGVPADRKRSCYVHPVWSMDGEVLTDDFPKDHYHHRGVFWTWQQVTVDDKTADLWTLKGLRQEFVRWSERRDGPQSAVLGAENRWLMGDRAIMKETVRLEVHADAADARLVDVDLAFEATDRPVRLLGAAGKGYGGLGVRFAPREGTVIVAGGEKQAKDSDQTRVAWADLSARFAGREGASGIAVMVHPSNLGTPNAWTLRHYGFLGPNWPGLTPAVLEPGKPVALKYRLVIHRGDAGSADVAGAYAAYAKSTGAEKA